MLSTRLMQGLNGIKLIYENHEIIASNRNRVRNPKSKSGGSLVKIGYVVLIQPKCITEFAELKKHNGKEPTQLLNTPGYWTVLFDPVFGQFGVFGVLYPAIGQLLYLLC